MIPAPSNRILALARLELLTTLRDRAGYSMYLISFALGFVAAPLALWLGDLVSSDRAERAQTRDGAELVVCPSTDRVPVSVDGAWPSWAAWPDPFVARADGVVHVVVSHEDDGAVGFALDGGDVAARDQVEACLLGLVATRRGERLAALGLEHDPAGVLVVEAREVQPAEESGLADRWSLLGSLLATLGLVVAGGVAIEAVPRRRASGLLEQLRSTQTRSVDLIAAWLLAIAALTTTHLLVATLAHLGSSWLFDAAPGRVLPGVHAPVLGLQVAAASVRTALHATDVQSASLRWFSVIFAQVLFSGLAAWWMVDLPWLAALVPLGGSTLAASGVLGGWGVLADLAGIGWSALVALDCARSLDGEDSASAGSDPILARRARGTWWPEAVVLGAMGLTTAVASGSAERPWLAITLAFVVFMVTPAWLAGPVLGIPTRELLPLSRPRPRDLLLVLPLTVGLFCLGNIVVAASGAVLPDNALLRKFASDLTRLATTPFGAVAIVLYPAVCEELLYRGAILGLLARSGRPRVAIAGQALAFSLAHAIAIRLPWTFVFGLVLGWLRVRTGSLWVGMAVHFLLNGSFVAWAWSGWAQPELAWLVPGLFGLAALPFLSRGDDVKSR